MHRKKPVYLICSADKLETAFFCGTTEECMAVLGIKNRKLFHCVVCKKTKVWNFFRVEKVKGVTA